MKQTSDDRKQVVIAGGGASGMCAAVLLARAGLKVTVLEKGKEPGKKLSMTGNGRCNLSNLAMDEACYHTDRPALLRSLLARYGTPETVAFFRSIGVPVRSEEGYLYPVSGEAKSVVNALRLHMEKEHVNLKCRSQLKKTERADGVFLVKTQEETLKADAVVFATGGLAGPDSTCSDGDGYYLAETGCGLSVSARFPALCRLLSDDDTLPRETGVRVTARVSFEADGTVFAEECGEVQLTKDAVSGIPVLQASASCAQKLADGKPVCLVLDLFPFSAAEETDALIRERLDMRGNEPLRDFLNGFSNGLINEMICRREGLDPETPVSGVSEARLQTLLQTYRALPVSVRAIDSFKQAQTTRGGVCLASLTEKLEAKNMPGLYVIGELCDVDGRCGGYNLQWAWTSAMAAADGIRERFGINR